MFRRPLLSTSCLVLAGLLLSCTRSQSPDWRLYKLHYENASGEHGVTVYDLSERHPSLGLWELLDGTRYSLNLLSYDEQGHLIAKERTFSDGLTSMNRYIYENGLKVRETFSRSDGRTGEVTYHYSGDTLTLAECRGLNGWFFGDIHYIYDAQGRQSGANIIYKGEPAGRIEYDYDEQGHQGYEKWIFDQGWSQTFRREYVRVDAAPENYTTSSGFLRNIPGWRIAHEEYDWFGQTGGPSYYEYAEDSNRLLRKRFVRSDGLETVTRYLYGARGELTRSFRAYADGRYGLFRYEQDDQLRPTGREFFRSDSLTGYERFAYDNEGRLVSAEYEKMDGWLTGSLSFEHDEFGNLLSGVFTGSGERTGLNAELTFAVNERGQPVRIHWDFGGKQTQTYTFEYESY